MCRRHFHTSHVYMPLHSHHNVAIADLHLRDSDTRGLIGCPDGALARPVGCKGPLIGCLVGVCSLAGGMQSERAGLAPEIRKFRPFLQSLAAVMRVECVGGLP